MDNHHYIKRDESRDGKEKLLYRAARRAHPGREVEGKLRKGRLRKSKLIDVRSVYRLLHIGYARYTPSTPSQLSHEPGSLGLPRNCDDDTELRPGCMEAPLAIDVRAEGSSAVEISFNNASSGASARLDLEQPCYNARWICLTFRV